MTKPRSAKVTVATATKPKPSPTPIYDALLKATGLRRDWAPMSFADAQKLAWEGK